MTKAPQREYAIVSPVRNEARYIRRTLDSVVSQQEPPAVWVIVDDGSSDDTAAIVTEYAKKNPFIRLMSLTDNGADDSGDRLIWAAEAIAFNTGLLEVDLSTVDFIVKLDGDLSFEQDYFTRLLDEFNKDASLGMAGGYCYQIRDGKRVSEWNPPSHVRGPTKMYRKACFLEIGGIEPVYAWDALDVLRAQMAGWKTRSFDLPVDHLKATGTVGGLLRARVRQGVGAYLLGYDPLFLFARSARLAIAVPYVVGGLAFLAGYLKAAILRPPRIADDATVAYLRKQQRSRLRNIGSATEIRSLLSGNKPL